MSRRKGVGRNRRSNIRGFGPPSGFVARTDDYYEIQPTTSGWTAGAVGPTLTEGASTVAVVFNKVITGNVTATLATMQRFTSATRGYRFRILDGTQARPSSQFVDGTPANRTYTDTVNPLSQNAHTLVHRFEFDGGDVRFQNFLNGVSLGAASSFTGYTAPTTETLLVFDLSSAVDQLRPLALIVANGTSLSDTQISNWHTNVTSGAVFNFPVGTTHLWDAIDATPGGTWVDQVGGVTITDGATVTRSIVTPSWA